MAIFIQSKVDHPEMTQNDKRLEALIQGKND